MTQSSKPEQNKPQTEAETEDKSPDALNDTDLDSVTGGFGGQGHRSKKRGA